MVRGVATVLLLRHGRTTANAGGQLRRASARWASTTSAGRRPPRSANGCARCSLAAVVTSPLPRCRQTVALAAPESTVTVDDRLIECGYGDWQGRRSRSWPRTRCGAVVQQHPSAVVFPGEGGESMAAIAARAVAAVRDWDARVTAEHGPDAVWLACSHGDVIKAIVADALGLHLDLFQRIGVDPASITVIRYTPTRPFLLRLNDTGGAAVPAEDRRRRGLRRGGRGRSRRGLARPSRRRARAAVPDRVDV